MKRNLTIRIKRRSQPEWLIWLIVMMPFLFGLLNELLYLPRAVRYILDIAWLILLVLLVRFHRSIPRTARGFCGWILIFLGYTFLAYLPRYQSGLYYLWGVRNNFRLYVVFLATATFLSAEDGETFLDLFDRLFWVNVVVSLVQYFVLGHDGDHLGGIFGTVVGGNSYTNLYFSIVLTRSLIRYMEKKESTRSCALKCVAALLVAVLAELKFFFVEFLLIMGMAVLITKFTWRKLWVILGGTVAVFIGATMLSVLFPNFSGWFSVEWILSSTLSNSGYTNAGDLNRLNGIPRINDIWLRSWTDRLFGLGLGNCDSASVALVNTPFFRRFGWMHYNWFSYTHMYLECGWVGLIFHYGFFGMVFLQANRVRKHSTGVKNIDSRMVMILSVLCMIISLYNHSLRTEAGYMMYFVLALPFTKNISPPPPRERSGY